jgi:hypothetical protein
MSVKKLVIFDDPLQHTIVVEENVLWLRPIAKHVLHEVLIIYLDGRSINDSRQHTATLLTPSAP